MRHALTIGLTIVLAGVCTAAEVHRALPPGQLPDDHRLGALRTYNDNFPFTPVESAEAWAKRSAELRRQVLVANGLWPLPTRTPLNAVIHGKIERDDYTVEKVFFESFPGHFVTGSLYRPKGYEGPRPVMLCPHGHWPEGRFHDAGEDGVRKEIANGAERFEAGGRYPLQARCVQLARMGCIVFHYDMVGYADSVQIEHHPHKEQYEKGASPAAGFATPAAELRLQNMMGLQTWNSIRAVDFLLTLPQVDESRIGVTGASGGGTQTFLLAAVDDRIDLAVPAVMVSTAMQGGCTCENAPFLRIGAGNIDLAALTAPRPQALIAADDWTREVSTKGFPDLQKLYAMLGHPDRVAVGGHLHFPHNYNAVSRVFMSNFVNKHFALGHKEPVIERDFIPLTAAELSVWSDSYPKPAGDGVGAAHEQKLLDWWARDSDEQLRTDDAQVLTGAWSTIIGRNLDEVGPVEFDKPYQKLDRGDHLLMTGVIKVPHHREQVPAMFFYPKENWNKQVVIVVTDTGKSELLDQSGQPSEEFAGLLQRGFAVAGLDVVGQGEFTPDGKPWERARSYTAEERGKGWYHQHPGLYIFGYNRPLFSQRVHDVLSMIRFVRTDEHGAERVHLLGIGEVGGPIAAAAKLQAGDSGGSGGSGGAVAKAMFDMGPPASRHFAVSRFDDPMFVPGAIKYGGVKALMALTAPTTPPAAPGTAKPGKNLPDWFLAE